MPTALASPAQNYDGHPIDIPCVIKRIRALSHSPLRPFAAAKTTRKAFSLPDRSYARMSGHMAPNLLN